MSQTLAVLSLLVCQLFKKHIFTMYVKKSYKYVVYENAFKSNLLPLSSANFVQICNFVHLKTIIVNMHDILKCFPLNMKSYLHWSKFRINKCVHFKYPRYL